MSDFRGHCLVPLATAIAATLPVCDASCASLQALGLIPGLEGARNQYDVYGVAVSGDGGTVAGDVSVVPGSLPLYWEAFGWTPNASWGLGSLHDDEAITTSSRSFGINSDGSVIVGQSSSPGYSFEAFRWTQEGGMVGLGSMTDRSYNYSAALAVSGDGQVVVGESASDDGTEAFRWTAATGMVALGRLDDNLAESNARDVNSDGSFIVGYAKTAGGAHAFRWDQLNGMIDLGDLQGGQGSSRATGVSEDGGRVVGYAGNKWFIWDEGVGMMSPQDLDDPTQRGAANDIDAAGHIVVGTNQSAAAVWTEYSGIQQLWDVLVAEGVDPAADGWASLNYAFSVSDDGQTVVGYGVRNGVNEGFVATIPQWDWVTDDIRGDLDGDGVVGMQDVLGFVMALVSPQEYEQVYGLDLKFRGDVNRDGVMNLADVTPFADMLNLDASQRAALVAAVPEPATGLWLSVTLRAGRGGRRGWRRG